jgi:nitrate/nitrite transport system ATP-binding protein
MRWTNLSTHASRERLELAANPIGIARRKRALEFFYERHRFVEAA